MKASPFTAALLALSVPTAALAHVSAEPAPPTKENTAVNSVFDAKAALDELEAKFAKLRPTSNTQFTVQAGAPLDGMPARPPVQALYGGFVGPKPSPKPPEHHHPVTKPTPVPQPLYGVFVGPRKPIVVHVPKKTS